MEDNQIKLLASTMRPCKTEIDSETKEALAAYFAGNQLYQYIYPFSPTENPEKLNWRRMQTVKHYRNFPKEASRQYVEGVFRAKQIVRQWNDESFDGYLANDYASWFKKEFAIMSLLLPELYILVSSPQSEVPIETQQDVRELELYPYPCIIYPQHVRDFSVDRHGKLEWITFQRFATETIDLYTDTEYIQIQESTGKDKEVRYDILSRVPHGFNTCPVVRVAWQENTSYHDERPIGHSYLKDLVDLSLANLQYTSMLVEMGYFHLSYKMIVGEETGQNLIKNGVGNATALTENAEEKGITRYLELPRMEIAELKDLVFEKMPAAAFKAARLVDRSATKVQSGVAKALDMVPETAALYSIAEFWNTHDEQVVDLIAQGYFGVQYAEKEKESKLQYPVTFDVRSPQDAMNDMATFANQIVSSKLPVSELAVREMVKRMQRVFLEDLDAETLATIDEETDNAPFDVTGETKLEPPKEITPATESTSTIPSDVKETSKLNDI